VRTSFTLTCPYVGHSLKLFNDINPTAEIRPYMTAMFMIVGKDWEEGRRDLLQDTSPEFAWEN
jgi:hypothetical protein